MTDDQKKSIETSWRNSQQLEYEKFLISETVNLTKQQIFTYGAAMDHDDVQKFVRRTYRTLKSLTESTKGAEDSES